MLAHVLEEIFLRPPGEKRHRHPAHLPLVIGREHRGLMARFLPLPHFPQPKTVAQTNASFGQFQLHLLPMDQTNFAAGLNSWTAPRLFRKLVIGDDRDAALPLLREELRRIARPVEDHGETGQPRIGRQRSAQGWPGTSANNRGTICSSKTLSNPGSAACVTAKNGWPSMALTQ